VGSQVRHVQRAGVLCRSRLGATRSGACPAGERGDPIDGRRRGCGSLIESTSPRFAQQIRDVHTLTSRAIARFLITGQGTTETERNFITRVGIFAARYGLSLAILSRSYVVWRDANLRVVNEEINRLGIGQTASNVARMIIRSSADTGLRRMARGYECQLHVAAREESSLQASAR